MNQKANFGDCVTTKTSPCKELASPSEKVIRLNCSKPSKQAKQLIIDCTARLEQLYLCEVKVYGEYRVVGLEPLSMHRGQEW